MSPSARYRSPGGTTIATGQVTLSTSSGTVCAASTGRRVVTMRNTDASISVYLGATGVTTSTGYLVKAGESLTLTTTATIAGVAASGSPVVCYVEVRD